MFNPYTNKNILKSNNKNILKNLIIYLKKFFFMTRNVVHRYEHLKLEHQIQ
jgi:hypothetical protein